MKDFIAHFHPLLVHLPIGILFLSAVFACLGFYERFSYLRFSLPVLMRAGAATAILSCFSGWLLGGNGDFDADTLQIHQWLGIATATLSLRLCFVQKKVVLTIITAVLLIPTVYFGSLMTHGESYFKASQSTEASVPEQPANLQEALVYTAIIAPVLREKCISCHSGARQKGGLRLDNPEFIQKGGKSGKILSEIDPGKGELLRRCLLPAGHEEHMPPKEKKQLSPEELELLKWWLAAGADFQKKTKDLPQSDMIKKILLQRQNAGSSQTPKLAEFPENQVNAAPESIVQKLRQSGLVVLPISQQRNWLSISFVNLSQPPDSVMFWMEKVAEQTLWLDISHCSLSENGWNTIGKLKQLRHLSIAYSNISDQQLAQFKQLKALQQLNLSHTAVSFHGLRELADLESLRMIFLYKTNLNSGDWAQLQTLLPQTAIDSGNYTIPFLQTDTARLKAKNDY